ncbi:MAG TPA: ShlB/FhaC/HecB family hemolysin secretion/activation protein [Gemmatimonadaceae bacterium]
MILLVGALALLQVQIQVGGGRSKTPAVRDSTPDSLSVKPQGKRAHRTNWRLPVTAAVLATAYKDANAKALLLRARVARLRQDSSLTSYDATTYQRISAGMGFGKIGRDRLIFRNESAARVRWSRAAGAWIDLKGERSYTPFDDDDHDDSRSMSEELSPIPYYPGYESLWVGGGVAKAQVDESEIINPIADGAEAYYTYESGDSVTFRLPDRRTVRLRELRVRPRELRWNAAIGSLWFDVASGQLVRAAYRLSIPIDVWALAKQDSSDDDVPVAVRGIFSPMRVQISAIAVEYGLYEGRFWLPRIRAADGSADVTFMHIPFRMEQSFKYASVGHTDSLPPIAVKEAPHEVDFDTLSHAQRDSIFKARRVADKASADSVKRGLKPDPNPRRQCDTASTYLTTRYRYGDARIPVAVRVPCDEKVLATSPDLPPSIFDSGDELFDAKARDALVAEALSLTAQPPLMLGHLPRPTLDWGLHLMRYNRIEGFSAGARVDQQIGDGYAAQLTARLGVADLEPNAELTLLRTNLSQTVSLTGYNRLVSASDWGRPLSFGSSVSALLFGMDEGFYYRASGAELTGTREALFGRANLEWRLFAERQRTAWPKTQFNVAGATLIPNVVAAEAWFSGAAVRLTHQYGLDPRGFRVLSDLRLEAAASDSSYARGALDLTASHGLGALVAAVTTSGGSSAGALPPQRRWFLGGVQTVRGQRPDTAQSGNAYWLARAELGTNNTAVRPTVFGDLGWVGNRRTISDIGRPMSGVGAGLSFLEGLVRVDLARGLYPRREWRFNTSVEARF